MKWWNALKRSAWYTKLTNWEYWPAAAFYWPSVLTLPWLALRSGHPCFYTAANPGIELGGLGLESKYQTLLKIPPLLRPKTLLVQPEEPFAALERRLREARIGYPLIAKPDLGFRGFLVRQIDGPAELENYLTRYPIPFLVQEFLNYPQEVGVLYYRLPHAPAGCITSLTLKSFLQVTGDGRSTVRALIHRHPRSRLQLKRLEARHGEALGRVPAAGERVALGVVGNHSKGTRFINGNHLIDAALQRTFDRLAEQLDGFSYGRFDLKCESLDALRRGRGFKIIEVNGICSEPTHIYDAGRISYWGALCAIQRHFFLIRRIAAAHHSRGVPYSSVPKLVREVRRLICYKRAIRKMER